MAKGSLQYLWVIEWSEDEGQTWTASYLVHDTQEEADCIVRFEQKHSRPRDRFRVVKYVPEGGGNG